ncbi:hypothetical protein CBP12_10755 [Oceanisphaera avium]|uniref:Endonuclease/exonuclease/phosphatase domain-containing protein n=2 Tax=Oceanisphaera avium TaxID=1903694 RepID=A0A1Y0D0S2_9GAMM|nr:hypothetical protein CBP12_10755 [Oceanisphaera avium]
MQQDKVRVATFNVALARNKRRQLARELASGLQQARNLAHILQQVRPDIVLLNEFDHQGEEAGLLLFCQEYVAQGAQALHYPFYYLVPSNTGVLAPLALQGSDVPTLPRDGLGFGHFPGQYAMVILSRFPFLIEQSRSFQHFLWKDMPSARLPSTAEGAYYAQSVLDILPLSSKNHLDLPVQLPNGTLLHLLASHPTPPIDEGDERRNSCRNHDELRLWHDYIRPSKSDYLYDDKGKRGGLAPSHPFIILGDLNADPRDGDGFRSAINHLLSEPLLNQAVTKGHLQPKARGGYGLKLRHARSGSPKVWTHSQGLRLDYVLPSSELKVTATGVYWPLPNEQDSELFWNKRGWPARKASSDHRLVWLDIAL